ncbi:protein kinase [Nonomuraea sp. NPDC049725]|uniref:serine/threonine protein kinase n=1 Tax=Nonomuraea sp. NPDC049725 TaxID=3154508 RepID=UPI0034240B1A
MPVNDRALIGQEVAGYYIEDIVGKGGMAVVYLALDPRLSRRVALKILNPVLSVDDRFRQRFILESRTVASIEHPNIIPIYEANADADGVLYIAMRYVDGLDLRRLIHDRGPLPLGRANRIFAQVAAALDAAHAHDLIHRDVKPANILLAGEHVYLTDFGITKHRTSISGLTQTDQFIGTPRYMSPEQINKEHIDGSADQYALACVVYEGLSGRLPFQRDNDIALLWAHLAEQPAPLTTLRPGLPPAVDAVMSRALAKSPEQRYPSCTAFVDALRTAIDSPAPNAEGRPLPGSGPPRTPGAAPGGPPWVDGAAQGGGLPWGEDAAQGGGPPRGDGAAQRGGPPRGDGAARGGPPRREAGAPGGGPPWGEGAARDAGRAHSGDAPPGHVPGGPGPDGAEGGPGYGSGSSRPSGAEARPGHVPGEPRPEGDAGYGPGSARSRGGEAALGRDSGGSRPDGPDGGAGDGLGGSRGRGGRLPIVVAGLVAAVAALALVVMLVVSQRGESWVRFQDTRAAPLTFEHPEGWTARTHADLFALASPRAAEFEAMFVSGANADWAAVNGVITGDPENAVGVYVQVSDTLAAGAGRDEMKAMLEGLLPGEIEVSAPVPDRAGNRDATRYDGSLRDRNTGNALGFVGYVIDHRPKPILMLYFCARNSCDDATQVRVRQSVVVS